MKIFGIDPGSERTGYGCVEQTAGRHHLVLCGSLAAPATATFPERLKHIYAGLLTLLAECQPDCVAVESIFHARNVRSALKLGHARGVALLAASESGLPVVEYAPMEIKRAVVGYGRAEKAQAQHMVKLLLGLDRVPAPHDVADALAVAICHLHASTGAVAETVRHHRAPRGRRAQLARVPSFVIARLVGTLAEKTPGRIIVDVLGVGYDVQVPLSTFYVIGEPGTPLTLRIHTHVREDVLALYGFATALEQVLFERLISISGIGPKLALAVLSGIEPPDLVRAIKVQDVARLTAIPGIGKKTAERIGLELKDRLPPSLQAAADLAKPASVDDQLRADLLSALTNLGYQRIPAERAIEKELKATPDARFEEALRAVLRG